MFLRYSSHFEHNFHYNSDTYKLSFFQRKWTFKEEGIITNYILGTKSIFHYYVAYREQNMSKNTNFISRVFFLTMEISSDKQ